jgi:hypothetical protein
MSLGITQSNRRASPAIGVIHPTFTFAVEFAVGLLAINVLASRIVSGMFDEERLVTGAKAQSSYRAAETVTSIGGDFSSV